MIHKQQMGCGLPDILAGLCEALVRNYLNNVGKGKEILAPVVFQGGVAANVGMIRAFEKALEMPVKVPPYYNVMGAVGAALLAREAASKKGYSFFKGFGVSNMEYKTGSFECSGCSNLCEVVQITEEGKTIACWGDRCGKWSNAVREEKIS
jgi:predicted NodU family carbamoyl transferase